MGLDYPGSGNRIDGPIVEHPNVPSPLSLPEKPECRIRKDRSWMWLVAALLVLLGGMALLIAMLLWLPGLRQ
jgi:hypothetical protein